MRKKIKIIEVNACSNEKAAKKLSLGHDKERVRKLFTEIIKKEKYDFIMCRDISSDDIESVAQVMNDNDFRLLVHPDYLKARRYNKQYTCLSCAFISNELNFEFVPLMGGENFPTSYRYIFGQINFNGQKILYRSSHIPCASVNSDVRKMSMLREEVEFQREMNAEGILAISAGDFNGEKNAPKGMYIGQELMDKLEFTDLLHNEKTYADRSLDHCFISKAFNSSDVKATAELLEDWYGEYTDHKIFVVEIKSNNFCDLVSA